MPDESTIVEQVLRNQQLPEGVHGFKVEFGEDSTGDPAVFIWFEIDDDLNPSQLKRDAYGRLAKAVKSELLNKKISYWPYIRFRLAA